MSTSKEADMEHGTAQARLTEDDMLRTGYVNGTPLEAGKIADSQPVDLFAQARRVADASSQQQQPAPPLQDQDNDDGGEGEKQQQPGRQGMAAPTGGGRRLGRQA